MNIFSPEHGQSRFRSRGWIHKASPLPSIHHRDNYSSYAFLSMQSELKPNNYHFLSYWFSQHSAETTVRLNPYMIFEGTGEKKIVT